MEVKKLTLAENIKLMRQRLFLSQESFARELEVALSTVNRWEMGKSKPNFTAMKNIKSFCLKNDVDYAPLEQSWLHFELQAEKKAKRNQNVSA